MNIFVYATYFASIAFLIAPIVYFLKLKAQRYLAFFSILFLISTAMSVIAYYYIEGGNVLMYSFYEMWISLFDFLASLALILGLHRMVFVKRGSQAILIPIQLLFIGRVLQVGEAEGGLVRFYEGTALLFIGASLTLYVFSIYLAYTLYAERRGGTFWAILLFTIVIIVISQTSFFVIEVVEEAFLVGVEELLIRTLSLTVRAILTLITSITLVILLNYHRTRVLPLLKEVEI